LACGSSRSSRLKAGSKSPSLQCAQASEGALATYFFGM
jgi:hypothetical protein